MSTATDQFLMFAGAVILAYLGEKIWRRFRPGVSAEESGYAPGSERIPFSAVLGILAVVAVFVFVFAHLGVAAGLT